MKQSERIVFDVYQNHPEFWRTCWRSVVARKLAEIARTHIQSVSPLVIGNQILGVWRPEQRAKALNGNSSANEILEEFVSAGGQFRSLLKEAFDDGPLNLPSVGQLRNILHPFIEESILSVEASGILTSVSDPEIYCRLADILSEELFQKSRAEKEISDELVLNYSFLVYHLRRWKSPLEDLIASIRNWNSGPNDIRGYLISIQNKHRSTLNSDDFTLPVVTFAPAPFPEEIGKLSDTLLVVQSESLEIENGNGFLHRALPVGSKVDPKLLEGPTTATQAIVEEGRKLNYPQYEHTALLLMSVTGLEFLLRSYCPEPCSPDESLARVVGFYPNLSEDISVPILKICSTDSWNVRNRCMHGSFLELEGRRSDLLRESGILEDYGIPTVDLKDDGSLPKNVSATVLQSLQTLADYLSGIPDSPCMKWTEHFLLTSDEISEANSIHCDILHDNDTAEECRKYIRDYTSKIAPCLSIPIQLGMRSWRINGAASEVMPGFFFFCLLFEPLLRLTLHLLGQRTLQLSTTNDSVGSAYRVQYRMHDSTGHV